MVRQLNSQHALCFKAEIRIAMYPPLFTVRFVLKECSSEIAPVLAYIFNESLAQDAVPDDWRLANATPIFKKGENTMLLITDRCRSRASAAKPWSIYWLVA